MPSKAEEVADAIFEACDYALPQFLVDRCARAAIKAMREPTKAMIEATTYPATDRDSEVEDIWRVMIDAALKD